jgi:hypothetical protein
LVPGKAGRVDLARKKRSEELQNSLYTRYWSLGIKNIDR